MKLILLTCAAVALAIFTFSIPLSGITSEAFASKMNGKGSACSEGKSCNSLHYQQATKAKTKSPTKKQ